MTIQPDFRCNISTGPVLNQSLIGRRLARLYVDGYNRGIRRKKSIIIGIISDTPAKTIDEIPLSILKALETIDLIVHAGDFTEKAVLDTLKGIGQVKAVWGNMDSHELKNMLPQTELLMVGEKRTGLVHSTGGPWGIGERVRKLFPDAPAI
jgi:hypothetical protein